jgi:c-di-GMP-binding flagellar brake protein YcgR
MVAPRTKASGPDAQKRRDRRFKQWNKTKVSRLGAGRDSSGNPPVEAFTYDISIGGARIHSMEAFDIGAMLRLDVELVRTAEILRVEGIVRWRKRDELSNIYEMGVEFQHSSMVTVLALMRALHDARRVPAGPQDDPDGLSRS